MQKLSFAELRVSRDFPDSALETHFPGADVKTPEGGGIPFRRKQIVQVTVFYALNSSIFNMIGPTFYLILLFLELLLISFSVYMMVFRILIVEWIE